MIKKTSTSEFDALRGVLALRRETYAVEHKCEYWVWALAASGAALSRQIHQLVYNSRVTVQTQPLGSGTVLPKSSIQ